MEVFSYKFFECYLTLEYFSETERFACAIAGFRKLEARPYQDAVECEYCTLQLVKIRSGTSPLNAQLSKF